MIDWIVSTYHYFMNDDGFLFFFVFAIFFYLIFTLRFMESIGVILSLLTIIPALPFIWILTAITYIVFQFVVTVLLVWILAPLVFWGLIMTGPTK